MPGLRDSVVAEVVAGLAVDAYGPQAGVELDRQKKVGAARHQASLDRVGGVVEEDLRVGGDAEVQHLLRGVLSAGRIARVCGGQRRLRRVVAKQAQQTSPKTALRPVIVGVMLIEAPLDTQQALTQARDYVSGLRGCAGRGG